MNFSISIAFEKSPFYVTDVVGGALDRGLGYLMCFDCFLRFRIHIDYKDIQYENCHTTLAYVLFHLYLNLSQL